MYIVGPANSSRFGISTFGSLGFTDFVNVNATKRLDLRATDSFANSRENLDEILLFP